MTNDVDYLAEATAGFSVFVVGVVAGIYGLELVASACFVTVGLIAVSRSYYKRWRGYRIQ